MSLGIGYARLRRPWKKRPHGIWTHTSSGTTNSPSSSPDTACARIGQPVHVKDGLEKYGKDELQDEVDDNELVARYRRVHGAKSRRLHEPPD